MSILERLRARLRPAMPAPARADPDLVIPPEVRRRLIEDNPDEPLWPTFRQFGKGKRGVTKETDRDWVIRDDRGRVVGGAVVDRIDDSSVCAIDVAIDPRSRRRGYATHLYEELTQRGIDIEASSNVSLRYGTMTELGYAFMIGRRRKALEAGRGPLADRLRETGIEGPDVRGLVAPEIEETFGPESDRAD